MTLKLDEKYDAWLHWIVIDSCNLNCAYCSTNHILKKNQRLKSINTDALIKTLDKTDKIFKISFTGGGEPFLVPNIIEACMEITKKHYILFTTNLTTKKVEEFSQKINPKRVQLILASLHFQEVERLSLQKRYVDNFFMCKEKGFNIYASAVAYPPLLNKIERYKDFYGKRGIKIKFEPYCGLYKGVKYPESYTDMELKTFNFDKNNDIDKFWQQRKICNAGHNVAMVQTNGDINPCYQIKKKIGNIYKIIKFNNNLVSCPFEFCICPLNLYDPYLFREALQNKTKTKNMLFALVKDHMKVAIKRFFDNVLGEK